MKKKLVIGAISCFILGWSVCNIEKASQKIEIIY